MKCLVLVLSLALLLTVGDALKCKKCFFRSCNNEETCDDGEVCGVKKLFGKFPIQRCVSKFMCPRLFMNMFARGKCCETDLCNTA
ncbi:long neurotoxin MS4-like [Corythoichthys intestinalis]|uniref:long neurotoxin MS4-like n=1 Tax=Corythoichthys intestinalis TaxID=161448 RepID=UPI0025A4E071|nr:long neurotoxin MS4-like [Corythoichthys intestinalis]